MNLKCSAVVLDYATRDNQLTIMELSYQITEPNQETSYNLMTSVQKEQTDSHTTLQQLLDEEARNNESEGVKARESNGTC